MAETMPHEMPTEQIPLDFEAPTPLPENHETDLESLSTEELEALYAQAVGYDPSIRFHDSSVWGDRRAVLIRGIENPAIGKEDTATFDREQDGVGDPYSGK